MGDPMREMTMKAESIKSVLRRSDDFEIGENTHLNPGCNFESVCFNFIYRKDTFIVNVHKKYFDVRQSSSRMGRPPFFVQRFSRLDFVSMRKSTLTLKKKLENKICFDVLAD